MVSRGDDPLRRLPFAWARRHGVVATVNSDGASLACRADASLAALAEARRFVGRNLPLRAQDAATFEQVLASASQQDSASAMQLVEGLGEELDLASLVDELPQTADLLEQQDDAPIIRLINALLGEALREGASDIHIEAFEQRLVVRLRVDGILREIAQPRRELAALLVSRVKVMARLDIAEKRLPQDGRFSLRLGGREVDVRVSTLPSPHGERVVLRLLDKQAGKLDLAGLGLREADRQRLQTLLQRPHGILLVTGPTGSGKTTTLYAGLAGLCDGTRNILTVEDPIEYHLDGIGQTQVNGKLAMTFARGLRAILRQDPDVVMVGEIRDRETAEVAVQASLTGHLVLSTLHTNSAVGAVTRLVDMGVEPFLLASSLLGVLAQRLVRVLCPDCKQAGPACAAECAALGIAATAPPPLYRPVGCAVCAQQGYRGRTGIYELVLIDEPLRALIHQGAAEQALLQHARRVTPGIHEDGLRKVLDGTTSVSELLRVSQSA